MYDPHLLLTILTSSLLWGVALALVDMFPAIAYSYLCKTSRGCHVGEILLLDWPKSFEHMPRRVRSKQQSTSICDMIITCQMCSSCNAPLIFRFSTLTLHAMQGCSRLHKSLWVKNNQLVFGEILQNNTFQTPSLANTASTQPVWYLKITVF